ncbi:hypothetical protein ACFWAX_26030, partial [Streptomyces sp. NPDC059956]
MSVDTRTPGFDDQPALSMVKVPCDPAQVIVNHASFRVRLAPSPSARPRPSGAPGLAPALGGALAAAGAGAARRRPVVWSGKSAPGDAAASAAMGGLLQAVREHGRGHDEYDGGATQVIPRIDLAHDLADDTLATPTVIGQRSYADAEDTRAQPVVGGLSHPHDAYDDTHAGAGSADSRRAGDARAQ